MSLLSPYHFAISIFLLLIYVLCGGGMAESSVDISQISISSVTLTPEIYEPGDRGTIELTIENRGSNSLQLESVTIAGDEIKVLTPSYTLVSPIGIGDSRTYLFDIIAPMEPGVYYPYISVNSARSGFLKYPVPIRVDSTKPFITVSQAPSSLVANRESTMLIQIANSRPDIIRNVQVIPLILGKPAAEIMEIIPDQYFIGTLESGEIRSVEFFLTPTIETDLTFTLSYQTGDNIHESEIIFPIQFSVDKKQAEMALSSVSFSTLNGVQQVTGDITNIGLEIAYSVTVTISEGASPAFPYKDYVLGTLDPDDFANFQLTFEPLERAKAAAILVTFKDGDGNQYTTSLPIELGGPASDMPYIVSSSGSGGGGNRGGGGGPAMQMRNGGGNAVFVGGGPSMGGSGSRAQSATTVQAPSAFSPYLYIAFIILVIGGAYLFYHRKQAHKDGRKMGRKGRKDINLMKEIDSYDAQVPADDQGETFAFHTSDEE